LAGPTLDYRPTDDGRAGVVWMNRFTIEMEATENRRVNVPPGVQFGRSATPETLQIEHIRSNRDILRKSDARHCQLR
jgi:hypothetical protein